jgi:hypothetical protein
VDRAYVNWADAYGGTRLTWYSYTTGGILTPFATALDATANPVPTQVVAATIQTPSGTPSTNPYPLVTDSAVLSFVTAVGSLVGVIVPGFQEALYLADNQTVDPAQPLVIALVAATLALPIVDSSGNAVVAFVGGLRQKRGY